MQNIFNNKTKEKNGLHTKELECACFGNINRVKVHGYPLRHIDCTFG